MTREQAAVISAVLYAVNEGCFFPVPEPGTGASTQDWVKWGALRHLHEAIAQLGRAGQGNGQMYQAVG